MIDANNLNIEFDVDSSENRSFKKLILKAAVGANIEKSNHGKKTVHALKNLNFNIREGDRVALVGHNGSGKTTLLRALAGIYEPTSGSLSVSGKLNSLLDIGVGLDSDSSGYDNIFIRGILLGLSRSEIKAKIQRIAEFSELGEFLSMPLRVYSSGMLLRLAFSIASEVESDVLLMDEWLSVGDSSFNEKAAKRLNGLIANNSCLILATHSSQLVSEVCNRVFFMEHGVMNEMTVDQYRSYVNG